MEKDFPRFSWVTHQYERHERSNDWYWILGIVAAIGVALSIVFQNYLLAILIALGATMIGILANREHEELRVEILGKGIHINKNLYPYKKIKSFWMYQATTRQGLQYRMILEIARPLLPFFTIQLDPKVDLVQLREYLRTRILEKEHREPALDGIMRNLKF